MATKTPMPSPRTKPAIALSADDRVAVIAGSGRLPVNVAAGLKAAGHAPFVVIVGGEAGEVDELEAYDHVTLELESIGRAQFAAQARAHHPCRAGRRHRPAAQADEAAPEPRSAGHAAADRSPAWRRATTRLLKTIVGLIEESGPKVVGAHEIVPDLLAGEGVDDQGASRPPPTARISPPRSLPPRRSARSISARQRSRSAGASSRGRHRRNRRPAGPDQGAALARPARRQEARRPRQMRQAGTGTARRHAGDRAADGRPRRTQAGLAGIGVEAGRSLILDYETVCASADALGLFVVGLPGGRRMSDAGRRCASPSSPARNPATCSAPTSSARCGR